MGKKRQANPFAPTRCDVCGSPNICEHPGGSIGTAWWCDRCGAEFDYYFRLDGEVLSVPPSWGRCVAVTYAPESIDDVPPEDLAEPEIPMRIVVGEYYYTFQADDGTIRRARIGYAPFNEHRKRPPHLPERITYFHFWNVDVCPAVSGM